ncbi:hypothetical protein F5I97DRAFT_1827777 [Phlebopus sp. FC_14]|nr:hypothetical protein F5I97DRAFT_1827777 [Phlebopus sp. FC_14]
MSEQERQYAFAIALTVYSLLKPPFKGKAIISILEKHGKAQYKHVSEAMDVYNESNYKEIMQKILHAPDDPGTTKIFGNMKHVEKLPFYQPSSNSENEESDCIKLAKLCKNDHNESLIYIGLLGATIQLTPAIVLDWACTLKEGQATSNIPPNIPLFDITNKTLFLHPACRAHVQNETLSSSHGTLRRHRASKEDSGGFDGNLLVTAFTLIY